MGFRPQAHRSERGAVLVHVAIGLVVLLAFSALAVDYGILWVSRSQAQNSADAGALAGAVALTYDSYTDRTATGPAVTSALTVATSNKVWGEAPSVTAADVTFPSCPASAGGPGDGCVKVDVFRNQERGNPLPTFFAQLVGVANQGVRATATAQVAVGNAVNCLKPWAVADRWNEQRTDTGVADPGPWVPTDTFDRFDKFGNLLPAPPDLDSYTPGVDGFRPLNPDGSYSTDYGLEITLKFGDPNNSAQLTSGWFMPLAIGGTGGDVYRDNISGCAAGTYALGETLTVEPGNMIGPTKQGVDDLVAKDPGASWDTATQSVVGSAYSVSPRVVSVPLFDVQEFMSRADSGRTYVSFVNIMGFFIEGMDGNDVKGRLVPVPGLIVSGSAGSQYSFIRVIRLVR
jgi:Flp pilus assembly protein TadG